MIYFKSKKLSVKQVSGSKLLISNIWAAWVGFCVGDMRVKYGEIELWVRWTLTGVEVGEQTGVGKVGRALKCFRGRPSLTLCWTLNTISTQHQKTLTYMYMHPRNSLTPSSLFGKIFMRALNIYSTQHQWSPPSLYFYATHLHSLIVSREPCPVAKWNV